MIYHSCKRNELRMVRGSTQTLEVRMMGPDGKPYEALKGDVLRFGIKYDENSSGYLLKKETSELSGGVAWFTLTPEDTIGMECGGFKYDIGLQSGEMYQSVVPYSEFVLVPNITSKE